MSASRVLVVDDNALNVELVAFVLEAGGFVVASAVDATAAIEQIGEFRPDLILMDIQLPGMDGLAATALLKQDPLTAAIPVIALTAMAMKEDREKTKVAGCDAYIAKPLRYQELYAAIDALLPGSETPSGSGAAPWQRAS